MSSPITTHVLDVARGKPAAGIAVTLEKQDAAGGWRRMGAGKTDNDGRIKDLLKDGEGVAGAWRLTFEAGTYFKAQGVAAFYRAIPIEFHIEQAEKHYHVPLLLSPFGYSTYRGS